MFLSQIMAKKLQVSASGLCIINRRLIISVSIIRQEYLWTKRENNTIIYEVDK